jgi:hypothetical protein
MPFDLRRALADFLAAPTMMTPWTLLPPYTASARQESGERKGNSKCFGGLKTVWTQSRLDRRLREIDEY